MFESEIPPLDMIVRLLMAAGLALLLGLERELRGKPAGLRSHMLVSVGASAFILIGLHILMTTAEGDPSARIDPSRIVEGVIGGIGFLGAGCINQGRGASIWISGAIGVACGLGTLVLASMVTALALIIVVVLGRLERDVIE